MVNQLPEVGAHYCADADVPADEAQEALIQRDRAIAAKNMADVIQVCAGQPSRHRTAPIPTKADPQKPPPVEMDIAYMFEQVGIHPTRKAGTEDRRDTYFSPCVHWAWRSAIDIYGPSLRCPGRPKR